MRPADVAIVAIEFLEAFEQLRLGGFRKQHGEQRVFLRARDIDLIQSFVQMKIRSEQIRTKDCA